MLSQFITDLGVRDYCHAEREGNTSVRRGAARAKHLKHSTESGFLPIDTADSDSAMRSYYVYIMTDRSHRTLYTGVTNNLERRVYEHKHKRVEGFTSKYKSVYLVYYEATTDVKTAIAREKQIKGWLRAKKVALIDAFNSAWRDLSADWDDSGSSDPSLRSG